MKMRFERREGGFGGRRFGGGGRRFGGGSFGRGETSDEPKPVKVGEEYDVEITETGSRGDGIARVKNFVVFVNGAKQGEKTKIKITDVRERFAIGEKAGAGAAAVVAEQVVEGTDDMGEAADVTKTEVAVTEDELDDEGDEESSDEKSSDEESSEEKE